LVREAVDEGLEPERICIRLHPRLEAECDPDLLRIVVANLVDNALKYAPPDTPVQVRTRAEDGAVHIEVHNEGPPLSPEDIARLFDRFWRARHGQNIPGVGLGLYLVRKIMRLHGGDAVARSAAGEGTTLRVSLPG
ncbi:MAG: sensor histidine kinase, partial [Thauera sp.]